MSGLVAITGGIGSGKSVVSRIVTSLGYDVYDCDNRAKALMDTDESIKARLSSEIHRDCVINGKIDRRRIAQVVFNDGQALDRLNQIVHSAVRLDLMNWTALNPSKLKFVETAILYQSGLDELVDKVWEIDAPLDLRIERVMSRNSLSREDVLARISSQDSFTPEKLHDDIVHIVNDGDTPLIPQIEWQLHLLKEEK